MSDDPNRNEDSAPQEVLREMEETLRLVKAAKAEIAIAPDDVRARFEEHQEEHLAEKEFINEICERVKSGSTSIEEAKKWEDPLANGSIHALRHSKPS